MITQKAVLTKDLKYVKDNQEFVVKKGTEVLVDITNGIALVNDTHVEIYPTEYKVLYLH